MGARVPLVSVAQSAISPVLAWVKKLAGARAAGVRATGTRIRDGNAGVVGDGRMARRWCSVMSEGGMRASHLESQSRFVFRRGLGARWRHNVRIGERTLLSVKQGGCRSLSRLEQHWPMRGPQWRAWGWQVVGETVA